MEYHWPFAICVSFVAFFTVGAVFLLWKYEGAKAAVPCEEQTDPSLIGIVPIGYLSREELWSSCGGALNPRWLHHFRAICFVYLLALLLYNIITDGFGVYFFYTQWTFTLLIIYFALSFRLSLLHFLEERTMVSVNRIPPPKSTDHDILLHTHQETSDGVKSFDYEAGPPLPFARGEEKLEDAGIGGYVTQCVFQALLPAAMLTDLVYWVILVRPNSHHSFIDINMHAVNLVLLLVEFSLNSLRFPWFRISYLILWSAAYAVFQFTLHFTGLSHRWPYAFLNVDTPYAPAWYLFIIVFHGICFAICLLLALGKQSLWARFKLPVIGRQ